MRKIFAILMALCILTVLVSSASACIPTPANNYCKPTPIIVPAIKTPFIPAFIPDNVVYYGQTSGNAVAVGGCINTAQVATEAGQNSATSGYSITNAYAAGDGFNSAEAWGSSGFHS